MAAHRAIDHQRRSLLALPLVAGSVFASGPAAARAAPSLPAEIGSELPGARLYGRGRLTFMLFRVYEARLWVGPSFDPTRYEAAPLAIELVYARGFEGNDIAERTIEEMRRSSELAPETVSRWMTDMRRVFPDVQEGDRTASVQVPGVAARFFVNGQFSGEIRDTEFTRLFFGIWLSPRTSEPKLRQALLAGPRNGS